MEYEWAMMLLPLKFFCRLELCTALQNMWSFYKHMVYSPVPGLS